MSVKATLAKPAQPKAESSANTKVQHPSQTANTPFNSAKQSSSTNTFFGSKPQILDSDSDDKKKDLNGEDRYS